MAQALPRASFNSAELVRLLAQLEPGAGANTRATGSRHSVAERLSLWLDWTDAVALSDALSGGPSALHLPAEPGHGPEILPGHATAPAPVGAFSTVSADVARCRSLVTLAIQHDELLSAATAARAAPLASPPAAPRDAPQDAPPAAAHPAAIDSGDATDFAPYRRCCLDHQRSMAAGIAPLRARVRAALASRSAALGQLAALDAVMDKALAVREQHLMSTVPLLLEKHFKRLAQAASGSAWLARFCQDMQAVLLAELAQRLQPIDGMVDTLQTETTRQA
jgi:hypothetical protein